jgi:hypothetical protein
MALGNAVERVGFDSFYSGCEPVAAFCEYDDEFLDSIREVNSVALVRK